MTGAGAAAMASPCTLERTIDCAGTRIPAVQAAAAGRKQVMSMPRYRGRHQPRDGRCAGASRFGFQKINGGGIHDAMPPEVGPTSTCLIYPRGAARGAAPAAACCPPELTLSQDAPMHKLSLGSKLVLFATRLDSGRAPAASRVRQADPRVASGDRRDDKETPCAPCDRAGERGRPDHAPTAASLYLCGLWTVRSFRPRRPPACRAPPRDPRAPIGHRDRYIAESSSMVTHPPGRCARSPRK